MPISRWCSVNSSGEAHCSLDPYPQYLIDAFLIIQASDRNMLTEVILVMLKISVVVRPRLWWFSGESCWLSAEKRGWRGWKEAIVLVIFVVCLFVLSPPLVVHCKHLSICISKMCIFSLWLYTCCKQNRNDLLLNQRQTISGTITILQSKNVFLIRSGRQETIIFWITVIFLVLPSLMHCAQSGIS